MDPRTRIAIIGCGGIGHTHARAYAANSDVCQLVACADVAPQAADSMEREFGCAAYQDAAAMLDDVRPDAISICTPPSSHLPMTQLAAERGIAVLCEKPLTRNLPEAQQMVELVQSSDILFMNGLCHRFHGPVQQARQIIQEGRLGRVIQFQNRFAFRFQGVEQRWFTDPEIAGGGILLDTAVHSLDLFRFLVGEVATVCAQISTTLPIQVEDSATLLLRSVDNVIGEISCSWVTPPGEAIVRIYGTDGTLGIDYSREPNLRYCLAGGDWVPVPFEGPDRFAAETRHFVECVRDGRQPQVTVQDGARAIALIDQAYASATRESGNQFSEAAR
ncbi:MAG: Gfo/Idh/MocA family oxidoreductase [Chloroflexi bacterium]|nr:Gfo/Idh/MocA family oxidoreductase [Chloroflexota bacterium]